MKDELTFTVDDLSEVATKSRTEGFYIGVLVCVGVQLVSSVVSSYIKTKSNRNPVLNVED